LGQSEDIILIFGEFRIMSSDCQEELKRGIWRNDDLIFLEQEIEPECAALCSKWAGRLEETFNDLIQDYLAEEDDEEK
jgi:hypothetical protein